MANAYSSLYQCLAAAAPDGKTVDSCRMQKYWSIARVGDTLGLAMATEGRSIPAQHPSGLAGLSVPQAASAVTSWNFPEASQALAVVNASLNTVQRLEALNCYLPYEIHYTDGLDFRGKTVGMIGHMHGPETMRLEARQVYVLERAPREGDYPDPACEELLPRCDIVLITGSALINKTLPRLLELSQNAYTILTGPSVPLLPELLEFGIDRMAGMVVTDPEGMRQHVLEDRAGSPYPYGRPFLLKR